MNEIVQKNDYPPPQKRNGNKKLNSAQIDHRKRDVKSKMQKNRKKKTKKGPLSFDLKQYYSLEHDTRLRFSYSLEHVQCISVSQFNLDGHNKRVKV